MSDQTIEARDLIEVCDITSPFYGHTGKVVRRIEGWAGYFIVEMDFMIVTGAPSFERVHLTFCNNQLEILTKHE